MIRTGFVSGHEPVFSYNIVGEGEARLDSALRARAWCAQHANATAADRVEIEAEIARCRAALAALKGEAKS